MNKSLSPFDHELALMISKTLDREVKVFLDKRITLSFDCPESLVEYPENDPTINAVLQAVKGRLGDRFFSMFITDDNIMGIVFEFDKTQYPVEIRTGIKKADHSQATIYCRTLKEVRAIQMTPENIDKLDAFVGGGILEYSKDISNPLEPRPHFTFLNFNDVFMTCYEGQYVVLDNGKFFVISEKDFKADFELK